MMHYLNWHSNLRTFPSLLCRRPLSLANHFMAAAGGAVLGSATFLVAVSGLLAPPLHPPRPCSPCFPCALMAAPRISRRSSPKKRGSNRAASKTPLAVGLKRSNRMAHELRGEQGNGGDPELGRGGKIGFEAFDAGAWKNIPSSLPAAPTAVPTSSDPSTIPASRKPTSPFRYPQNTEEDRAGAEKPVVDIDVEKLPTFVFFGTGADGKVGREDVVGGGDARSCAVELQEKFASLWPPGAASPRSRSSGDDSRLEPSVTGGREAGVAGGSDGGAGLVGGGGKTGGGGRDDAGRTSGSGTNGIADEIRNNDNFVEISSRGDLLRVIDGQKQQGLVVVMYHARWCRKCAYLTPVFRRLAASGLESSSADEGRTAACVNEAVGSGSSSSSSSGISRGGLLFCRVDVSDASWGKIRVTSSAAAPADSPAARAAVMGRNAAASAAVAGTTDPPQQARGSYGVGDRDAALSAAGSAVSDGSSASLAAPTKGRPAEGDTAAVADLLSLHEGSPAVEDCEACGRSGFVPCGECEGRGALARSSPDGKHTVAVTCPACVGYKRLRCPSCGGKCYMCE